MTDVLTTKELARVIGVSESSVKRWADGGALRASRTAGGHRRITVAEAIRFIRDTHASLVHPELLGLADVAAVVREPAPPGDDADQLYEFLAAGAAPQARGLLQSLFLSGSSLAAIVDGPIRVAMQRLGALWQHDPSGIFLEHRATDICAQALHQIRVGVGDRKDAPVALGGAPEGDPYALGSLAAAAVLAADGFAAVNLGPQTPLATMESAAAELRPLLVWLSVSTAESPERLAAGIADLARRLGRHGVSVVVGGRALHTLTLPALPNLHAAESMAELAAFARGLRASTVARPAAMPDREHFSNGGRLASARHRR
jgi:MerR family transcriptional regulator, light-induced transcriptional regulator